MKFKAGDKVRCVDTSGYENHLSERSLYTVVGSTELGVWFEETQLARGHYKVFRVECFELVEEPQPQSKPMIGSIAPIESVSFVNTGDSLVLDIPPGVSVRQGGLPGGTVISAASAAAIQDQAKNTGTRSFKMATEAQLLAAGWRLGSENDGYGQPHPKYEREGSSCSIIFSMVGNLGRTVTLFSDLTDRLGFTYSEQMSVAWCLSEAERLAIKKVADANPEDWSKTLDRQRVDPGLVEAMRKELYSKPAAEVYEQAFRDAVALLGQVDVSAVKRLQKLHPEAFEE